MASKSIKIGLILTFSAISTLALSVERYPEAGLIENREHPERSNEDVPLENRHEEQNSGVVKDHGGVQLDQQSIIDSLERTAAKRLLDFAKEHGFERLALDSAVRSRVRRGVKDQKPVGDVEDELAADQLKLPDMLQVPKRHKEPPEPIMRDPHQKLQNEGRPVVDNRKHANHEDHEDFLDFERQQAPNKAGFANNEQLKPYMGYMEPEEDRQAEDSIAKEDNSKVQHFKNPVDNLPYGVGKGLGDEGDLKSSNLLRNDAPFVAPNPQEFHHEERHGKHTKSLMLAQNAIDNAALKLQNELDHDDHHKEHTKSVDLQQHNVENLVAPGQGPLHHEDHHKGHTKAANLRRDVFKKLAGNFQNALHHEDHHKGHTKSLDLEQNNVENLVEDSQRLHHEGHHTKSFERAGFDQLAANPHNGFDHDDHHKGHTKSLDLERNNGRNLAAVRQERLHLDDHHHTKSLHLRREALDEESVNHENEELAFYQNVKPNVIANAAKFHHEDHHKGHTKAFDSDRNVDNLVANNAQDQFDHEDHHKGHTKSAQLRQNLADKIAAYRREGLNHEDHHKGHTKAVDSQLNDAGNLLANARQRLHHEDHHKKHTDSFGFRGDAAVANLAADSEEVHEKLDHGHTRSFHHPAAHDHSGDHHKPGRRLTAGAADNTWKIVVGVLSVGLGTPLLIGICFYPVVRYLNNISEL